MILAHRSLYAALLWNAISVYLGPPSRSVVSAQEEAQSINFDDRLPFKCRMRRAELLMDSRMAMATDRSEESKLESLHACIDELGFTANTGRLKHFHCPADLTHDPAAESMRRLCSLSQIPSRAFDMSYVQTCKNHPFVITDRATKIPICIPDGCNVSDIEAMMRMKLLGESHQKCQVEFNISKSSISIDSRFGSSAIDHPQTESIPSEQIKEDHESPNFVNDSSPAVGDETPTSSEKGKDPTQTKFGNDEEAPVDVIIEPTGDVLYDDDVSEAKKADEIYEQDSDGSSTAKPVMILPVCIAIALLVCL